MAIYGVAITVPEPWGSTLQEHRSRFGDPMAAFIPPHVTLLPPTEVDDDALKALRAHLDGVVTRHRAFTMVLAGTGTFRPVSPVVFVQVSQGISSCEQLETDVRSGPVRRELEFNYHPHVTVAHHVDDGRLDIAFDALAGFRAEFEVTQVDLYSQGRDEVWRPLSAHRLSPGPLDA